jgi:glycosyltransferase involved in cell wall biosynthesis
MSRILVIGGWAPSLVNFRGALLEAMRERGHDVIACAGGEDPKVTGRLKEMGVRYAPLDLERASVNPLRDLRLLGQLIRLMCLERPDAVLAYTIKPVVYGLIAARLTGVRGRFALITGLGYTFIDKPSLKQQLLAWIASALYRIALSGVSIVFFQNNDDKALFLQRGLIKQSARAVRVMGSGVDLEHFGPAPLPQGVPVFLLMARLLVDKGIREFVEAARIVRDKRSDARFALLGPYDSNPASILRDELQAWVDEGIVEYWGKIEDVRPSLARCTVFVLPSYREGMPHSVLEAMSMARPIIATDVPGCRDTVKDGVNGYLVPVKDADALAKAMLRCLEEDAPLAAMGGASRTFAEKRFGVHAVNRVLLETMGL